MNDNEILTVPYVVYEGEMARSERMVKRLFIALVFSIVIIFASNACWMWLWNQYDYVDEESVIDIDNSDGYANYIGNDGEIYNGFDSRQETQEEQNP